MILLKALSLFSLLINPTTSSSCDAPTPAFPLPNFDNHGPAIKETSERIISTLKKIIALPIYNTTSFSIEVTSQTKRLFSLQHTARERSDLFGGGAKQIDSNTRYRIASITKTFTAQALLQLEKAGNLSLDDTILKHLPQLGEGQTGTLPWKDITIRALMSQQAGIPRDFAQDDWINDPKGSSRLGLPKINPKNLNLPKCDAMVNYTRPCNETDLLNYVQTLLPMFAPNQHSSYSNINFDLLGLIISKVSQLPYEEYIHTHILTPRGMNQTTFHAPPDSVAAIPRGTEYYWPLYIGVQNPTGGLYSSSSDLSIWLRYILSSYNAQTPSLNWLAPTSFGGSIQTFYGAPWEIFRASLRDVIGWSDSVTTTGDPSADSASNRPVSFITKSGGLPGYTSDIIILPEYGLGITLLAVGDSPALRNLRDVVSREVVKLGEEVALHDLREKYAGTFEDKKSGSKLVLLQSKRDGLFVSELISNGVDTVAGLYDLYFGGATTGAGGGKLTLYVVPTLLFIDEKNQRGERWRIIPGLERTGRKEFGGVGESIWDNFCVGDWEFFHYGGLPINEVVFWTSDDDDGDGDGERIVEVELVAFRSTLRRVLDENRDEESGEGKAEEVLGREKLLVEQL